MDRRMSVAEPSTANVSSSVAPRQPPQRVRGRRVFVWTNAPEPCVPDESVPDSRRCSRRRRPDGVSVGQRDPLQHTVDALVRRRAAIKIFSKSSRRRIVGRRIDDSPRKREAKARCARCT